MIKDFINDYGANILCSIITALVGYIGIEIKRIYVKYINDETKKSVVRTCVKAVEQLYKDLHGEEKLNKCIESVSAMLCDKGIAITDIEVRMLIESAVNEFNNGFTSQEDV
ncbi:MAG: hypothetical protein J6A00_06695 [Bacteroides sp.]|nr:hypothetical protein [Bacteroides sp.]